jgi:hypothetical protein
MQLSPTDRQEVLKLVAQGALDEIRAQAGGDLAALVVLPLSAAGQLVGLTGPQVRKRLPVTQIGPSTHGVTLKALREHIEKNTKSPAA